MSTVSWKLGVVLATGPETVSFRHGVGLASAAVARGIETYLYCLDDAVAAVPASPVQELRRSGVRLFACALGAQRRRLPVDDSAAFTGLASLSDVIAATDRCVCFSHRTERHPAGVPGSPAVESGRPPGTRRTGGAIDRPQRRLLVVVDADPRTSPRAAEALRIATGVAAWGRVSVAVSLHGAAVRCLDEWRDELAGGDELAQCVPVLCAAGEPVYYDAGSPDVSAVELPRAGVRALSVAGFLQLSRQADVIMRF